MVEDLNFCELCGEQTADKEKENEAYLVGLEKKHLFPGSKGSKVLNEHLLVYFIANKLLELTKIDTLKVLTSDREEDVGDGGSSGTKLRACYGCGERIDKALELHWKVVEIQSEIRALGNELKCRIESFQTEDLNGVGSSSVGCKLRELLLLQDLGRVNVKLEKDSHHQELVSEDELDFEGYHGNFVQKGEFNDDWGGDDELGSDDEYETTGWKKAACKKTSTTRKHATGLSADGNFHCDLCESVYTTVPGIRKHERNHRESDLIGNKYDCSICRHPNLSESNLRRHMKKIHNVLQKDNKTEKLPTVENASSQKQVSNPKLVSKSNNDQDSDSDYNPGLDVPRPGRKRTHTQSMDGNFHCDLCESVYTTVPGIKKHRRMHTESNLIGNKYDCTICRHPNLSESKLRRHKKKFHGIVPKIDGQDRDQESTFESILPEEDNFSDSKAKKDGNSSDSDSDYTPDSGVVPRAKKRRSAHVSSADGNFHCDLCESVYTTVPGIKKHQRMHRESSSIGNVHDCTICRHPNLSEAKLRRHMTIVHQKVYELEQSQTLNDLYKDINITDENHVCQLCKSPVVYTSIVGFRRHLRIHQQSNVLGNAYDCLICGHPTVSERNLRRHLTIVHHRMKFGKSQEQDQTQNLDSTLGDNSADAQCTGEGTETSQIEEEQVFRCKLCESVYTSIVGYRKHMRIHEESELLGKKYDCSTCRHPNISESNLRRHMSAVHQIKASGQQQIQHDTLDQVDGPTTTIHENEDPVMEENYRTESITCYIKTANGKFRCKLCKSIYTTVPGIRKHEIMHEESNLLGNKYDCTICRHPNLSDSKLRRHMTKLHGIKGWRRQQQRNISVNSLNNARHTSPPDVPESQRRTSTRELKSKVYDENEDSDASKSDKDDDEWLPYTGKQEVTPESAGSSQCNNPEYDGVANKLSESENLDELVYRCLKCNVGYKSARGYQRHKKEHEISVSLGHKYDCHCGFPASSARRLRYHKRWAHFDAFVCYVCEHQALTTEDLKVHMRKHYASSTKGKTVKQRPVIVPRRKGFMKRVCNICNANYWYQVSFKRHMRDHESSKLMNGIWDCCVCNFPCLTEKKLALHMKRKHNAVRQRMNSSICNICDKKFQNSELLKGHMRIHEEYEDARDPTTGLFRCKLCPYVGLNVRALMAHKSSLHREAIPSRLLCADCGKGFYTALGLKKHVRNIHENIYTYRCEQCGKGFDSKGSFNAHKLTHLKIRPKEHICETCGAAYSHKSSLLIHIGKIHSLEAKSIPVEERDERRYPTEKDHVCKWCHMVFPFKYMLFNHIPTAHQDLYTFACDECDKKYMSASSLRLHKNIVHSNGEQSSTSCEYCQKIFAHRQYVTSHYRYCSAKRNADQLKN